jgi:hypothetical protein
MNAHRSRVVSEGIGEQSKGELVSRLSAAFAPAETVRRVPAQVKAGIERLPFCALADCHLARRLAAIEPLNHDVL